MHICEHHTLVQKHVGTFSCRRCFQRFGTKSDVDDHLRQQETCGITLGHSADPEDGITNKHEVYLRASDNWVSLWKLLFPHDRTVPDHSEPYVPYVAAVS